jgi:hypothetical protein
MVPPTHIGLARIRYHGKKSAYRDLLGPVDALRLGEGDHAFWLLKLD